MLPRVPTVLQTATQLEFKLFRRGIRAEVGMDLEDSGYQLLRRCQGFMGSSRFQGLFNPEA